MQIFLAKDNNLKLAGNKLEKQWLHFLSCQIYIFEKWAKLRWQKGHH